MKEQFEENRQKIYSGLAGDWVLVLFAGKAPVQIGDEAYDFSPERNFYYMTGIDSEELILFVYKCQGEITENLYIKRADEKMAKWVGHTISADACTQKSGIANVYHLEEFHAQLANILFEKRIDTVFLNIEKREWGDEHFSLSAIRFAEQVKTSYPYITIKNIYHGFAAARMLKEEWDVDNIRQAIAITKEGVHSMMQNAMTCKKEYELEAYFDFALKRNGVMTKAFATIVAAGQNATTLHYRNNNGAIEENDLILCDLGAQYDYYKADITRTIPARGRFTDRQKTIYNIVLGGQQAVIDAVKPGLPFTRLNEILKEHYVTELKKIGLITEEAELDRYYYHGVSHMLGLETHDIGRRNEGVLKEGMVFTVEPGLYIAEEKIGIRIEDDILVTATGCEVLSKEIIKSVAEIENMMQAE